MGDNDLYLEQLYLANKRVKKDVTQEQVIALSQQLRMTPGAVEQWFEKRAATDANKKEKSEDKPSSSSSGDRRQPGVENGIPPPPSGNAYNQRTARYRANATTVDFSKPLSEETRPMQKLTNRDIKALQVYVRDLADQMQKFIISPATFCATLGRVAARATIYLEDFDYTSNAGIVMVLVEEFSISRPLLDDASELLDSFGRLLCRQACYSLLATSWNNVEHAEELKQNFANVLGNAHIKLKGFELQRKQRWIKDHAGEPESNYEGPFHEHFDVLGQLAWTPWEGVELNKVLRGEQMDEKEVARFNHDEPPFVIDCRLDIFGHTQDYDSIREAVNYMEYQLRRLRASVGNEEEDPSTSSNGDEMKDDQPPTATASDASHKPSTSSKGRGGFSDHFNGVEQLHRSHAFRKRSFEKFVMNRLQRSLSQMYFKLQEWEACVEMSKAAYGNRISDMTELLQLMFQAAKKFVNAREHLRKLFGYAIDVECSQNSYYINSAPFTFMVVSLYEMEPLSVMLQEIRSCMPKLQIIQHARYILDALARSINHTIHRSSQGVDHNAMKLAELGLEVMICGWNLKEPRCRHELAPDARKEKTEKSVMCQWLLRLLMLLGCKQYDVALLVSVTQFALEPEYENFRAIQSYHHQMTTAAGAQPQQPHTDQFLTPALKDQIQALMREACKAQGLTWVDNPDGTQWNELIEDLFNVKNCDLLLKVKIALEARMYPQACELTRPLIGKILPQQLHSNAKTDEASAAKLSYSALEFMLSNRSFVAEEPKFCYESASQLVHNVIAYHADTKNPLAKGALPQDHFSLVYDGVKVMCYVVKQVRESSRVMSGIPQFRNVPHSAKELSKVRLYQDLDNLRTCPGLPKDTRLLENLWSGMADVIQTCMGFDETKELLVQQKIMTE